MLYEYIYFNQSAMIQVENLITKVEFGTENKASISVSARKGTLTLQMLATEKQIGDKLELSDIQELPKVVIDFNNTKSIDILIKALEVIKRNYVVDTLALAC